MAAQIVCIGDLEIDLSGHRVRLGGQDIRLGRKARALLETLAGNANQIVTARQLLSAVWGEQYGEESKYLLHVAIGRLREKIGDIPARIILAEADIGYRLVAPPALRAATVYLPAPDYTNLLAQRTSFVGRERDCAALLGALDNPDVRLLTLAGPGGVGKTRLAAQIGEACRGRFANGVALVSLAAISDPALVAPAIVQVLGIKQDGAQDQFATLCRALHDKHLLLILDNFEQVLEAGAMVGALLAAAPRLKAVITSREAARVYGEHEYALAPLELPDPGAVGAAEHLADIPAIALFVARARAARPSFSLEAGNCQAVAAICARLDGIPLAIELVATCIKSMPPQAILARLDRRLDLVTTGPRDVPPRHQSLREVIAWSYHLLSQAEQRLFARLAVFVGAYAAAAAAAVCDRDRQGGTGAALASLAAKNLVQQSWADDGEPAFTMLETIRAYALERLQEQGDLAALRQSHAEHYLALAEQAAPELTGPNQARWLATLSQHYADVRAALAWLAEAGEITLAARFGAALWYYWQHQGLAREGRAWLEPLIGHADRIGPDRHLALVRALGSLARSQGDFAAAETFLRLGLARSLELGSQGTRAAILNSLGLLYRHRGYWEQARACFTEALALPSQRPDSRTTVVILGNLGEMLREQGDSAAALSTQRQALALARQLGEQTLLANALNSLGLLMLQQGDLEQAQACYDESLALHRAVGGRPGILIVLTNLGELAEARGQAQLALTHYETALRIGRELDDPRTLTHLLCKRGSALHSLGDEQAARKNIVESLQLAHNHDLPTRLVEGLIELARISIANDQPHAARLLKAASRMLTDHPERLEGDSRRQGESAVRDLRSRLRPEDLEAGAAASIDDVIRDLGPLPALLEHARP